MNSKMNIPHHSVSEEEAFDLQRNLNSLQPNPIEAVLSHPQRIALLQSWIDDPGCFASDKARFIAEETARWVGIHRTVTKPNEENRY
jgi:hypothetical protein